MRRKMAFLMLLLGFCTWSALAQDRPPRGQQPREDAQRYSIEQAVSDEAQLHTIAFGGLAFLTGDFGYDTFPPPGKVSDYFGFQYMRDIDANEGGHNTSFLTRVTENMAAVLNDDQKAQLLTSAQEQQSPGLPPCMVSGPKEYHRNTVMKPCATP